MQQRIKLDENDVEVNLKKMTNWSTEELTKLFEKYTNRTSLTVELEAAHRLLGKKREYYLSDKQYSEIESIEAGYRTNGEGTALDTRNRLQRLHAVGKSKYFSLVKILKSMVIYGIGSYVLFTVVATIIVSLLRWYSSSWEEFLLLIPPYPINYGTHDFWGRIFVIVLVFLFGCIYYCIVELIPDFRYLHKSYQKNIDRFRCL